MIVQPVHDPQDADRRDPRGRGLGGFCSNPKTKVRMP